MAAPANDQIRIARGLEHVGVSKNAKYGVGDACAVAKIEMPGGQLAVDVDDVAQDGKELLANAANHRAIDESISRRVDESELDAAVLLDDLDLKVGELL